MADAIEGAPELPGGVVESDHVSKLAGLLGNADAGETKDSTAPDPGAGDDAPERASGEGRGQREPSETAIEPPASWDAAAKERFSKLDRDTQEFLVSRETERERGVNSKLQELAESRKKADAHAEQVSHIRNAYETRLVAFAKQLESSIPEEFRAIKSAADLYAVSQKDPALAARFTAFQQQAASVMAELAQIQEQRAAETSARQREYLAKESDAIAKAWPEFADATKGPAIRSELSAYAAEREFSEQEISGLADHRLVLVLRDAVEGRKAIAALDKAKAKADKPGLPKVAKPGQGDGGPRNGVDRSSLNAALKSGNTDKQVAAMARILEGI